MLKNLASRKAVLGAIPLFFYDVLMITLFKICLKYCASLWHLLYLLYVIAQTGEIMVAIRLAKENKAL